MERERDMITWSQSLAAHSFAPGPRKQNRFWRCYKIMDVMAIFTRLVYWKLGSTQFCFSRTSFLVSHFARVYVLCQRGVIAIFQLNCVFLDTLCTVYLHLHLIAFKVKFTIFATTFYRYAYICQISSLFLRKRNPEWMKVATVSPREHPDDAGGRVSEIFIRVPISSNYLACTEPGGDNYILQSLKRHSWQNTALLRHPVTREQRHLDTNRF